MMCSKFNSSKSLIPPPPPESFPTVRNVLRYRLMLAMMQLRRVSQVRFGTGKRKHSLVSRHVFKRLFRKLAATIIIILPSGMYIFINFLSSTWSTNLFILFMVSNTIRRTFNSLPQQ